MAERLDAMSKDHKETIIVLTQNLKAVSDTMTSAITFTAVVNAKIKPQHASLLQPVCISSPTIT